MPAQNWGLIALAIGSDVTWLGIAFLLPPRFRRVALLYAGFLVLFSVLVVALLWF